MLNKSKYKGFSETYKKQFNTVVSTYLLTLSLIPLLYAEAVDDLNILQNSYAMFKADGENIFFQDSNPEFNQYSSGAKYYLFNFKQINIRDKENREFLIKDYLNFIFPILFNKLYESFKDDKDRWRKIQNFDWLIFLANLRHASSHGINMVWDLKHVRGQAWIYSFVTRVKA